MPLLLQQMFNQLHRMSKYLLGRLVHGDLALDIPINPA